MALLALYVDPQARAELSRLVRQLRIARSSHGDLPQRVLAERLDIAPGSLVDWEVERDAPTMFHLVRWAYELNLIFEIVELDRDLPCERVYTAPPGDTWEAAEMRRLAMKLHAARLSEQRSQAELAAQIGVNRWSISRWESGHGHPRPLGLLVWARALKRSVQLLPADPVNRSCESYT